jgi:hypothetical protein
VETALPTVRKNNSTICECLRICVFKGSSEDGNVAGVQDGFDWQGQFPQPDKGPEVLLL